MSQNSSAKYCQKYKERLQKKACERDQNLSEEEKQKKQLYGHECYNSLSEDEKSKLFQYRKNIIE